MVRSTRLSLWHAGLVLLLAPLALVAGCQTFARAELRDDIVAIHQYPKSPPWLFDADGRVRGLQVRVYLVSAQTGKGAFVPGTIDAALVTLTPRPDGSYNRQVVHHWTLDQHQAMPYRIVTQSPMGYSYGLILPWPPELRLEGREIQVVYSYRRGDGETVRRAGSRFRVDYPAGYRSPQAGNAAPSTRQVPAAGQSEPSASPMERP